MSVRLIELLSEPCPPHFLTAPVSRVHTTPSPAWGSVARWLLLLFTQPCPTVRDPMDCSTPGLLVHHQLPEFTQTHVHHVGDAIQPSHLCCPLLLLPSVFPSISVFSTELVFHIRWLKYWSFSPSSPFPAGHPEGRHSASPALS